MKILFVSAVLPYPLYSGGQIRVYNLLKRLSILHEIHLFSFVRTQEESQFLDTLSFCKKVTMVHRGHAWRASYITRSLVGTYPFLMETYHNKEMEDALASELTHGHFDMVHIEPGYVWPSIPHSRVPVIVGEHNIEHFVYEGFVRQFPIVPLRPFLSYDVNKLKYWEKRIWADAAGIVCVSDDDRRVIQSLSGRPDIAVVPNGVDLTAFPFKPKKSLSSHKLTFLYVGNFRWMENRDALLFLAGDIWPALRKQYPMSELHVVGQNPPATKHDGSIKFLENVRNIQSELALADALLAPIRIGGGTKFKILEAMAAGVPVITTSYGAQGLGVVDKKHILLAETPDEFIQSVDSILNQKKRMAMLLNARRLTEKEFSWDTISKTLDGVWKGIRAH